MKFGIRFADQIVGLVIILALASVAFVIVMLGQAQRWFAKDMDFTTVLPSAGGLSKNMAVQYRGFTIGNVKDFYLNDDDNVEVIFTIHEDYTDRVKNGSIVEMQGFISFLGFSFLFHPGTGEQLAEGAFIPIAGTPQAIALARQGLSSVSQSEDSISNLMNQVNSLLGGVNNLLADLGANLGPDETHSTEVGLLLGGINTALASVDNIPEVLDSTIEGVLGAVLAELRPLLNHVDELLATLNEPGGIITMVDRDGALNETIDSLPGLIDGLSKTIAPLPGLVENLNNTTASLPSQLPGILAQLRTVLRSVDDVLVGLANNPLIRGGVPEKPVTQTTGPRNVRF